MISHSASCIQQKILVKLLSMRPDKLQTIKLDNFSHLAIDFNVTLSEEFLYDK